MGAKRSATVGLSLSFHLALAIALLLVPLFLDESLPLPAAAIRAFFVETAELAPPPPPPPPPPPAVSRRPARRKPVVHPAPPAPQRSADFVAPIEVPEELPLEEGLQIDLGYGVEGGVEGGVPGGVVGGIVGGIPELPPPPPPRVVRVGGALQPPALIRRVPPEYPKLARDSHIQGVVIVEAHVDAHGLVKSAEVLRGPKLLDLAALAAVRQWRYRPLLLNGLPTEFIVTVTVEFKLVQKTRR